jgi:hypothetical protein
MSFSFSFRSGTVRENGGLMIGMKRASRVKGPVLVLNPKARLFDQIREVMRFHHYALSTERTYCHWVRRYLAFHRKTDRSGPSRGFRHPTEMGPPEVAGFLAHLAVDGDVAASTQNPALHPVRYLTMSEGGGQALLFAISALFAANQSLFTDEVDRGWDRMNADPRQL